jgi:hypothetical protein
VILAHTEEHRDREEKRYYWRKKHGISKPFLLSLDFSLNEQSSPHT